MALRITVSVIMPLYQKAATVRRAIDSARAQTMTDFELLVVDDGSNDDGPDIVRQIGRTDARIRLIGRPNGGPGAAKNTGLHAAQGSLITFLDADDEWRPDFLERGVLALESHPECDVFASASGLGTRVSTVGMSFGRRVFARACGGSVPRSMTAMSSACLRVIHSCSSVFRTDVVRRFRGFYERNACRFGEDVYLWLQPMLHCVFFRSFEILAWYHTDASDLGLSSGRRDIPVEPVFTDPEPIRAGCPEALKDVLEQWLAMHARSAIQMYAEFGDRQGVQFLLKSFPRVRRYRKELLSVWLKLRAPRLFRLARMVFNRAVE